MTVFARTINEQFVVVSCYKCAISFAIPQEMYENVHDKNPGYDSFYCPNGHSQVYQRKSYEERIAEAQREAAMMRDQRDSALAEKDRIARGNERLRKRIKVGVCPCCHRTFKQLASHMKNKHPDYAK